MPFFDDEVTEKRLKAVISDPRIKAELAYPGPLHRGGYGLPYNKEEAVLGIIEEIENENLTNDSK
jgi:hypothetical protein